MGSVICKLLRRKRERRQKNNNNQKKKKKKKKKASEKTGRDESCHILSQTDMEWRRYTNRGEKKQIICQDGMKH